MTEVFRHKRGGGLIYGTDSAVGSDCLVDSKSRVEGCSFISSGSEITNSAIKNASISSGDIRESVLLDSHISDALVYASALEGAVVRGTKERDAVVQSSLLSNKVVVEGCTVRGIEVNAPLLIHSDWNKTPRYQLLVPCEGVQMAISECSPGGDRGHCGCYCKPYSEWIEEKETLRKVFAKRGWPSEAIDIVHQLFETWRRPIAVPSSGGIEIGRQNNLYVVPSSMAS